MKFRGILNNSQDVPKKWIAAILAFGFGLMVSTGDAFAVLLALFSIMFFVLYGLHLRLTWGVFFVAQYVLIQLFFSAYHDGLHLSASDQGNYVFFLVMLIFVANLIQNIDLEIDVFERMVFFGLACSIGLMLLDYYTSFLNLNSECRAAVLSINPLLVAAGALMVFFPLLATRIQHQNGLSFIDGLMLAAVLAAIGALLGARMAFYAALMIVALLIVLLYLRRQFKSVVKLVMYSVLGLVTLLVIDTNSNCGFSARIVQQFDNYPKVIDMIFAQPAREVSPILQDAAPPLADETYVPPKEEVAQDVTPSPDVSNSSEVMNSGGSRAVLWQIAFAAIAERPFLGYGFAAEEKLIDLYAPEAGLDHVHNQFLSWLIWGGVFGLVSGLLLLIAPLLAFKNKLAASVFGLSWAMVLVTDSFMLEPMMLAWYIFGLLIFERLPKLDIASKHPI